jgi:hypothetical protein
LCVPILHKTPKHNPFIVVTDVDAGSVAGGSSSVAGTPARNSVAGIMGGGLDRPMGCKAAKAQKKAVESTERSLSLMHEEMASMRGTMERRSAVDQLYKLAKTYRQEGQTELARDVSRQMRELIESNSRHGNLKDAPPPPSLARGVPLSIAASSLTTPSFGTAAGDVGGRQVYGATLADSDEEDDDEETFVPSGLGIGRGITPPLPPPARLTTLSTVALGYRTTTLAVLGEDRSQNLLEGSTQDEETIVERGLTITPPTTNNRRLLPPQTPVVEVLQLDEFATPTTHDISVPTQVLTDIYRTAVEEARERRAEAVRQIQMETLGKTSKMIPTPLNELFR